jgi:hemoglobin
MGNQETLYERLGGYDAIYAFTEHVLARLMNNDETGVIWNHMSEDRVLTEIRNFVDFACEHWGGPQKYRGRDLIRVHKGMGLTERHWQIFFEIIDEVYEEFGVAEDLREEVRVFLKSFKAHLVGSPSFRDVVRGAGSTKISGGMESFGIKWP